MKRKQKWIERAVAVLHAFDERAYTAYIHRGQMTGETERENEHAYHVRKPGHEKRAAEHC